MGDWLDSKGKRLLLYIALCVILFVVGALVASNIGEQVHEDTYVLGLLAGPICFAGSIFYFITYDTLYDDDDEKSVGQKIFLILGLIVNILIGGLLQILYFGAFDSAIDYSPWFFALAAPWLMSGLLTLDLYEFIFQSKGGGVKMLLPFISLVICYIIYLILGYNGRSSSFIYAGIGLIICGVLFVAFILKGVFRIIAEHIAIERRLSQRAAGTLKNEGLDRYDFNRFERADKISFSCNSVGRWLVSAKSEITELNENHCYVEATLYINIKEANETFQGFESIINGAKISIDSWFKSNIKCMPLKYRNMSYRLNTKVESMYKDR